MLSIDKLIERRNGDQTSNLNRPGWCANTGQGTFKSIRLRPVAAVLPPACVPPSRPCSGVRPRPVDSNAHTAPDAAGLSLLCVVFAGVFLLSCSLLCINMLQDVTQVMPSWHHMSSRHYYCFDAK